ncbi:MULTISPECIES: hypothetical protein [Neisseria]|uniref:Uncharacterized protein n=1 Tax=Neisseria dumasiana TaxID=1931275 RepID=A0A1X3DJB6_9NEIS|nr:MULTISPECIES: hypothetical protein [Neisseria]KPN73979.1 hypothetical protein AKG43_05265 [Neisseria sp. 74A18]OSI23570.1 hypothetical protein BV912_03960 [Neisseria dumasiana]
MNKAKIENYLICGLFILPILVFTVLPAHAESGFDFFLNSLIDRSIFADGYYKPPRYPFAARVVNAFSVVCAVIGGIVMGIWRRDSVIRSKIPKNLWLIMAALFVVSCYMFWISITPQEFKVVSGRSFGVTESFHNNPVLFLFLMVSKSVIIYVFLRASITYSLYLLSSPKKSTD